MRSGGNGMFRSLSNRNFRLWVSTNLFSNIGTWMQGTAQTWLVLTELTDHSAGAVGILTALQFLPQVLLVAVTGSVADHVDRRKLLITIQCFQTLLALSLGALIISGLAELWHVYIFGFALGCCMAFEAPARHSFVSDLVGDEIIGNAVAMNSTAFQTARMIGPALAGLCIALVGTGWVFVINGLSYLIVTTGLLNVRVTRHAYAAAQPRGVSRLLDGFRYVAGRPDIRTVFLMLFFFGTLGMNFGIFISVMAATVYQQGASEYGLLTSIMAIGSVTGALLTARRDRPRMHHAVIGTFLFGCFMTAAALSPSYILFGLVLIGVGLAAQTSLTSSNGFVQLATDRAMRGRVMAIYVAITLGGLPLGAPLIGWVADTYGARAAMGVGGAAGFLSAAIGLSYLIRVRNLRFIWDDEGPRLHMNPDPHLREPGPAVLPPDRAL
ncbi:MFS family permease [Sphingobium sp. B1D7B]|uniref:MFS transporter n=2 Tax=unclassified Sphingobium TaxID=2611147 RepID=UPI00222575F7|nr:MFS transporter [Sphingobium sp. B1D7B]MCW2392231.1 MFS family permease [Sphingobium sp. B11D3A]MCW2403937.1 MFS family permease [Sphingobium sp. B1D7B]